MLRHQNALLTALAAVLVVAACSTTSQTEEREMGAADAARVDSQLPLVHDSATVATQVGSLGRSAR